LIQTLKNDVVPWLEQLTPKTKEQEQRLAEDPRAHWFTLVFDREGYSPGREKQLQSCWRTEGRPSMTAKSHP
jgi:hypothetical protein